MVKGIDLESVSVGYEKAVLKDITLHVKPGQIVSLIGPNGAGKSTVLKTITRQLKKLSGSIYISGENEREMSEEKLAKHLSMVMTERIHPELMSCYEVVSTGRYPYTGTLGLLSKEDKDKVTESMEMVGALDIAGKDFMKISDGQRQRIMLARAIAQEPEIMILDEPTSFLDIQYKLDILGVIKKLAKAQNIAVLMSIHELEFVPAISDYVVAVEGENISFYGTPDEVMTGNNIEKLYHMPKGAGKDLVQGLLQYSESLKKLL